MCGKIGCVDVRGSGIGDPRPKCSDPVTPAPSGRDSGFAWPSLTPNTTTAAAEGLPRGAPQRPGKRLPPPLQPPPPSSSERFCFASHTFYPSTPAAAVPAPPPPARILHGTLTLRGHHLLVVLVAVEGELWVDLAVSRPSLIVGGVCTWTDVVCCGAITPL
ncbi:hypothetical protein E2C01_061363 [Portunus trituberculatus]|uniref:Uncharacterized protein n=1 Tax=Portunus trituberculatus TaxID=210409 RepID=A0A5B7HB37_PORTR|nr:hypothetical protein [Portunus trituberculatus]